MDLRTFSADAQRIYGEVLARSIWKAAALRATVQLRIPQRHQNGSARRSSDAVEKTDASLVTEGSNMPSTPEAAELFSLPIAILYAPGKAVHRGRRGHHRGWK